MVLRQSVLIPSKPGVPQLANTNTAPLLQEIRARNRVKRDLKTTANSLGTVDTFCNSELPCTT